MTHDFGGVPVPTFRAGFKTGEQAEEWERRDVRGIPYSRERNVRAAEEPHIDWRERARVSAAHARIDAGALYLPP